jgi:hypothetical protein
LAFLTLVAALAAWAQDPFSSLGASAQTISTDMALIWASYTGDKRNPHLNDEYLCTFEMPDQQLFYFNGHAGGVCGIQILGAPESGKSFLTNYLIAQARKYSSRRRRSTTRQR